MSTNIVYNGVTYTIPATDDVAWGDAVSNFLIAIPDGMLTKVGGAWALTGSDLDLGAAYGLSALYLKTKTATPALSGVIRLAYADAIAYRAEANNKDLVLKPNSSNFLTWDNIVLCDISSAQVLTNKAINAPDNTISAIKDVNIAPDAAIAVSKIDITAASIPWTAVDTIGKIKDADVASDAAIAGSKIDPDFGTQSVKLGDSFKVSLTADPTENYGIELPKANGSTGQALAKSSGGELEWVSIPGLALNEFHVLVGNASNNPTDVDTDTIGDIKASEAGGLAIKALAITNAMINASAAIAFSKLEALPLPLSGGTLTGLLNLDETGIRFDTVTATPGTLAVGQTYWDDADKTIATKLSADSTLQHGQELLLYVLNNSGGNIADGSVVYINSANPARPTIRKAQANLASTADLTIGVTTHAIADSAYGYICTFGFVRGLTTNVDSDAQAVTDGTPIYLSATTAGGWVKNAPTAPNHRVRIGQVLNAGGGTSGTVLVSVEHGNHLDELHDVKITGIANNDTFIYDSALGYWKNRADVKQYTLEERGFVDPAGINIAYNKNTRKFTLTHATAVIYLNKGRTVSLGASWTSTAHGTDLDKKYFLYLDDTDTEQWFESFQGFEYGVYIGQANAGTVHKFGIRECHGLMPWQSWKEFHQTIGTYIVSGGLVPAASWTANTYTTVAVTPAVEVAVIQDEDLPTTVPAFTDGSTYTRLHFDSGLAVLTPSSTLPFPNDGTNIQYNQNPSSGTALTAIATNARFVNVYDVLVPATSDADSQVYRHLWLTGQQIYTTLAAAQGEDFRTLITGDLANSFPEFIPYARITYERQTGGGSTTTFNARIPTGGISYLIGNRASLASVSGFTPTDHNTLTGRADADSHPASAITGTAVTLAGVEVLTNKDIDGGTASNTSRLTVPKDSKTNLDGLTRKEGTLVYASDLDTLFADNGSALVPVGSSSSTGEKNYITNSSAALAITGWTAVGDLAVSRTTTAAELPREFTTASGIKITADADTQSVADYVYYDFNLDDVDLNKKLKITWAQKMTGTYASGDFAVVITSQADRTTALHTPVTTSIANVDGVFTTSFDAGSTATLSLVIRSTTDMATNGGLVISDVVVGPGSIVTGAVVEDWKSLTFTSNQTGGTHTITAKGRRVGDSLQVKLQAVQLSSGGTLGTAYLVSMPSGLTINTALAPTSSCGFFSFEKTTSFGNMARAFVNTTTTIAFREDGATTNIVGTDFDTNVELHTEFTVPIAEWAGSGTVNLAQNDVEFASNSAWATNTTSFVYGPAGSAINGALDGEIEMTVNFQTPIQSSDALILEGSSDRVTWVELDRARFGGVIVMQGAIASLGAYSGAWISNVSATSVKVLFGKFSTIGSDGTTVNWPSSAAYWRVRKTSAGAAVGFGAASASAAGLLNYYDTGTFNVSLTGAFTSTITCSYIRVGKLVTVVFPGTYAAGASNATIAAAAGSIPSGLSTATTLTHRIHVRDNNADKDTLGYLTVDTNGSLALQASATVAGFTINAGAASTGFSGFSISYITA
jgi:hypothetical protein